MNKSCKGSPLLNRLRGSLFYVLLLVPVALSFLGCSGGKQRAAISDSHLIALELNNRGDKAYREGGYTFALAEYLKAFNKSRSLDDMDSVAVNALNLTVTYRKMGDHENAHRYAEYLLKSKGLSFAPHHLAQAAYLKALLLFDRGEIGEAAKLVDVGLDYCKQGDCLIKGSFYNLRSRIAIWQNDFLSGKKLATQALKINISEGNLKEKANSLRLLAGAMLSLSEVEAARISYMDALAIDRKLGLSSKIALDLEGVGKSLFKLHSYASARSYFERALSVLEGEGKGEESEAIASLQEMIGRCDTNMDKR